MNEVKDPQSALYAALAKFQAELPDIATNHTVKTDKYSYEYADLAEVSRVVLPLLGKHGMAFTARPMTNEGGKFVLSYKLVHEAGGCESGEYPITTGTPQSTGSAITYARRYCLYAVTGVFPAGEDDDGQKAESGYRHSRGEAPNGNGQGGGNIRRPGQAQRRTPAEIPDDWKTVIDGIVSREDADKARNDLVDLWKAKKIAPGVAQAIGDQIKVKAAEFPPAEAVA